MLDTAIHQPLSSSRKSKKVVTQATKRPREDIDNPVIVVNTPDETAISSKANNISYNTHQKEKVAFNLNYLNNKKKQGMSLIMNS